MDEYDDLDGGMDERLARAGRAWRAGLPEPGAPVLGARPRRWLVPAAVAAAVVLVIGGAAAVIGPGSHSTPPPTSDVPATHPHIPSHAAGPTAAELQKARACGAGDLQHSTAQTGAAAGTAYVTTRLSLTAGRSPCTVARYFGARLFDHGTLIPTGAPVDGQVAYAPLLITRARPALLSVGWSVSHVCGHYDNTSIRVDLHGAAGSFDLPGFGPTTCNPGEPAMEHVVILPISRSPRRPS